MHNVFCIGVNVFCTLQRAFCIGTNAFCRQHIVFCSQEITFCRQHKASCIEANAICSQIIGFNSPKQAEIQTIADKLDELLVALRRE